MGNNLRALAGELRYLSRPEKIVLILHGLTVCLDVTRESKARAIFSLGAPGTFEGIMRGIHGCLFQSRTRITYAMESYLQCFSVLRAGVLQPLQRPLSLIAPAPAINEESASLPHCADSCGRGSTLAQISILKRERVLFQS